MRQLCLCLCLLVTTLLSVQLFAHSDEEFKEEVREAVQPFCIDYNQYSYDPIGQTRTPCEPYTCNPRDGRCKTSCLDNVDCADGYLCSLFLGERTCQPVPQVG